MSQENPNREAALSELSDATGATEPDELTPDAAAAKPEAPEAPEAPDAPDAPDALIAEASVDAPSIDPGFSAGTYTIKGKSNGKYLCREANHYIANRDAADQWEKFTVKVHGNGWTIQDYQGDYLAKDTGSLGHAVRVLPARMLQSRHESSWTWQIVHVSGNDYALEQGGHYLTAEPSGVIAFDRTKRDTWETFTLTKVG